MSNNIDGNKCWLNDFLEEAYRNNLCTKINCTTCGAKDFRINLCTKTANVVGIDMPGQKIIYTQVIRNESVLRELVRQLSLLNPDNNSKVRIIDAVRLILYEVWNIAGEHDADVLYWPLLGNSWASEVLATMKEHSKRLVEERGKRAAFESPEATKERRDKRKRLKQIKHAERLEIKKKRDKAWFENHPRDKR